MTLRGLAALAVMGVTLLVSACGGGSGRQGTDLAVSGSGPTGQVQAGQNAVFEMQVANVGSNAAANVTITNVAGNGQSLASITCTASGGAACPDPTGPVMTVATIPPGGRLVFEVTTTLSQAASGTVTNTMSATFDGDTDRSNNSATASAGAFTVVSDLAVSGSGPAATATGGDTIAFQMTVTNNGPDAASGVHFADNLGNGLSNINVACSAGGGATCPAALGPQMDVDGMPSGGSLVFTVSATVSQSFNGTATNTMQVTADHDNDRSNNSFTATAAVATPQAAIVVNGQGPAAPVASGKTASFVMTLSNPTGPDAAAVHLVDTVGGNLTLTSITCSASGGAACPATTGAVMDVSSLPVGGSLVFTVNATVALGTQGTILNTLDATTTSGARASASAVASGSAFSNNVSVSGVAPAGPLAAGAIADFTMTVANAGPSSADHVSLSTVPSNGLDAGQLVITCRSASGMSCPQGLGAAATIASIPSGASFVLDVAAPVVAGTNATVAVTMTATADGDSRLADNTAIASVTALSPDLGVSETVAATAVAGGSATFTATVSNPSSVAATGVRLTQAFSGVAPSGLTVSCSPAAACPDTSGCDATSCVLTLATLPARQTLSFSFVAQLPASSRGPLTGSFGVVSDSDPNAANDQASASTNVVDPRSGSYEVFAADGKHYTMTIDFDAGSYTMSDGSGAHAFGADGSGGYTVGGNVRFRIATDLIVGGHAFGTEVLPYVAARNFGSTVNEAVGSYNLMTRDVPTSGLPATHAAVAQVSGNSLFVCQVDTGGLYPPSACPSQALKTYTLTVSNNVYTAVETGGGATQFSFYLVRSDASKAIIGAGAASTTLAQLRIGLLDAPTLAGGTSAGASSSGQWISAMTLTASSYAVTTGAGAPEDATATLFHVANSGVGAMLAGQRSTDSQRLWVMQSSPLAIAFGDYTASGAGKGLLQITLP